MEAGWCGRGCAGVSLWKVSWVLLVLQLCCLWSRSEGTAAENSGNVRVYAEPFEGVDRIRVVGCTSDTSDTDISVIKLFDARNSSALVYITLRSLQCRASSTYFTSCDLHEGQQEVTLKAIINDLAEGEVRSYGCEVLKVVEEAQSTFYYINVSFTLPTTTTTSTPSTTDDSTVKTGNALDSAGGGNNGLQLPNSLVFIILGLLVFFITLCCVLSVHYYRGRRRKRKSGDCDAMSVRSGVTDKDFYTVGLSPAGGGFSGGGAAIGPGRLVRQLNSSNSSPPNMNAPDIPGSKRMVMQYQKPSDSVPDAGFLTFSADRGYVSGSSVHYQEPWGRNLDDPEILGKLSTLRSPNRSLVKIPDFDATLPCSTATAPPTQETEPAPPDLSA